MDENCWSRSIEGGRLEGPDYHPPEEIFSGHLPEKGPGQTGEDHPCVLRVVSGGHKREKIPDTTDPET